MNTTAKNWKEVKADTVPSQLHSMEKSVTKPYCIDCVALAES